ncbi:carbohydrate ABC transporter permease [Kribbella speibonae]|uniref:Carbohydrate ABC transporter permease n=1 Tax=Kribbella speibonae TaxID=1572660 RepID=A0A4R0JC96_9ACTN|nr:carbohydrate ABC transporter permease [Kribbella speibonae]TCC18206.1 carbohydrate ABC transporter permease [Kribbella speibonae]TCC42216.1 carbohydrate ABC transporter permease [Kribbella speibonae]
MSETSVVARRVRSSVSHVLLIVVAIAFLGPLVYAVSTSLKPADEVFTPTPHLFGSEIRWKNYADAFTFAPFDRYFLNSLLVAVAGTLVVVAASSMSAYAFARLKFRGREQLFVLFLGTLMVPQEVLIVPMYWLMQALGWVDSYWALILPWAFTAFGTFLLRQFFLTIPAELEEAARVDGCGPFGTFLRIMLPLARPAIAVLTVFTFISFWGSFLWPLIIINSVEDKGTVPLGLAQFVGQQGTQWNLMMAASIMAMLPTVLLVVLLQKHLVRGLLVTGLGGR